MMIAPFTTTLPVRAAFCLLLPGLLFLAAPAQAQTLPQGFLPTRNSEPLNTLFLTPVPTDASVLAKGRGKFAAQLDIVNNLLTTTDGAARRYVTDFEEQRLTLAYSRGIGDGQELMVRLPLIARNGGFLDEIIDGYHKVVGLEGGGRGNLPHYRNLFQITNAGGQTVVDQAGGTSGIGDMVLEYRRQLTPRTEGANAPVAASVRALLKLPTGRSGSLLGSGAADVGLGAAVTARPGRQLALHGNLTAVFTGAPRIENFQRKNSLLFHTVLGAEYLANTKTSLLLQVDDNPAPFVSGIDYVDRSRRAFSFGLWRRMGGGRRFYLSTSENDFGFAAKTAPDFTISTGLEWRL